MKNTIHITAEVPTTYQYNSIRSFGMEVTKHFNGGYTARKEFDSREDAKAYLISRAENYAQDEHQLAEMLEQIQERGCLTIDACMAYIDEID